MVLKDYVVEHMEEGIYPWVVLEYLAISNDVGGGNHFHLTSVTPSLLASLPKELDDPAVVHATSQEVISLPTVKEAAAAGRVCLLDPAAPVDLSPEDAQVFDWFVFGGILGDDPPRDRTGELRKYGFQGRRLGPFQMTTDTAIRVTKIVIEDQVELNDIEYVDNPELKWNKQESTQMPFRYVKDKTTGEPIMPKGMREHIRKDTERAFDDFL
ncbi:SAM-dependent RNA methyltransferase [Lipomyces japonicus]|uniref:SAM-dependent RNA methyltransferase n=1 Tax=Lipomyces japonicus TaxID=56871 RepID=UPI0034CF4437